METEKITDAQRKYLFRVLSDKGMSKDELEKDMGGKGISELSKIEASSIIDGLLKGSQIAPASPTQSPQAQEKQIKAEMTTSKASSRPELIARMNGIPPELADMFFMLIDGSLYIKAPGLLYMASKKGYSKIDVKSEYDNERQEWTAQARVYPRIQDHTLELISRMPVDTIEGFVHDYFGPTTGYGRASKENVKNTHMYPFLKEMAETRAVNRALRLYTGYGGTSYEELPDSNVEVE